MLLIFFLVTSSMDTDKGLLRQLPPPPQEEQPPIDIQKDHVMNVTLDALDQLGCNGTLLTSTAQLTQEVMDFVKADPERNVISIQADRQTTYEAYYRMQNAIVAAYQRLRATGHDYPMRISEQKPTEGGER